MNREERDGNGMERETIAAPGGRIVLGEPAEDYHANPAIGRTDLMTVGKSPAKFQAQRAAKEKRGAQEEEGEGSGEW